MVEVLKIHSILFEITDCIGLGKDVGFVISLLFLVAIASLDYAYFFAGIKKCLIFSTGLWLFGVLFLNLGAASFNLKTPELIDVTRTGICTAILNVIIMISVRIFKTKVLDPHAEIELQREVEQLFRTEGINPNSLEAMELLQSVQNEKGLKELLNFKGIDSDDYFSEY